MEHAKHMGPSDFLPCSEALGTPQTAGVCLGGSQRFRAGDSRSRALFFLDVGRVTKKA